MRPGSRATRNAATNAVTDSGAGVYPYLKQRGNGGSNVWSCPNAIPGSGMTQRWMENSSRQFLQSNRL